MRDIPRFVELMEKGQYLTAPLATTVVPLEGMLDAYEQVAYRTTITAIDDGVRPGHALESSSSARNV